MQEREIINKIGSLRKIGPNKDWVVLTKNGIFDNNQKETFSSFLYRSIFAKPAMTAFATLGFVALIFVSAQGAYPGDPLYPVKKVTEKSEMFFSSQENRHDFNVRMVNRRLDEISGIVKKNQIEKLSLAVKELEEAKAEIQKDFARSIENKEKEEKAVIARDFASVILGIEDKEDLILESLTVKVDDEKSSAGSKDLAFLLIQDAKERKLNEKDELLLTEAKDFFEQGSYSIALRIASQIGQSFERENNQEESQEN